MVLSKKIFWFISIVVFIIVGIIVLKEVQQKSADIDYESQPYIGEASAPVNIIEFGDYKCPHCKDFNDNIFPIIHDQFVKTGKAKFYFVNTPFISEDSTTSAQFAETVYQELGKDSFWEFHHLLFENQLSNDGNTNTFTDQFLEETLTEVTSQKEAKQVKQAYDKGNGNEAVKDDLSMANKLGVTSTPTVFVDGKKFEGNSTNDLTKMIEEASEHHE